MTLDQVRKTAASVKYDRDEHDPLYDLADAIDSLAVLVGALVQVNATLSQRLQNHIKPPATPV